MLGIIMQVVGTIVTSYVLIGVVVVSALLIVSRKERQALLNETLLFPGKSTFDKFYRVLMGILIWPMIIYWGVTDE